jgi:diguanylate cyclase
LEQSQDFEEAHSHARNALAAMTECKVPATPENYAVWYMHVSGAHPDLSRAIDLLIGKRKGISAQDCRRLYERYVSHAEEERAVVQTSADVQSTVNEVLDMLSVAADQTAAYGAKLEDASGKLDSTVPFETLKSVVVEVLADTRRMEAQNQELEGQLRESSDQVAQLRANLETVRREAQTDALTGIANRKELDRALRQAIEEAHRSNQPLSLLMLDIDHFKQFNDNHGHQIGDQVLKLVARTLRESTKGRDLPARYGGEEFAIVLPMTAAQNAMVVAEHVRKAVASKKIYRRSTEQNLGSITMSIGAATLREGEAMSELVHRADKALYRAKKTGRNRSVSDTDLASNSDPKFAPLRSAS